MKGLIFLLLSLLLVGVLCRPAEPEVRHFGVQPDNPNVKVFFTYPTVPPRIDNPNDLEKGTQNEEKEKYVKNVLKEAVKAKGEGLSKEADKEATVATETLTETTNNDLLPIVQDAVTPDASNRQMQEDLATKEDSDVEKPFTKSKDFASQNNPDNLLGGFLLADTMNGEEDLDTENYEEAREDVDQEGSITINQFPSVASEVSPGLPEQFSPIEGDEEATDNGDSEGTIVVPLSAEPVSGISATEADFTRHSEIDDEAADNGDITSTPLNEQIGSPTFGISVIYPDEEATAAHSPMEDSDSEMQNMPTAVGETTDLKSGVPLIPIGVEMVPVVEVVEMDGSTMPLLTPVQENNPEEGLKEMVESSEPIMDPIGVIPVRALDAVNVEVMPSENLEESPMMREESNPEMEESLLDEKNHNETMTINEEVPSPIAEVEPNVNMPISDVDEAFMLNQEGIQPRMQDEDEAFLDYMSETDGKLMETDLAAAPQAPNKLMPIMEAEVPMDSDLSLSEVPQESGSMINDQNEDLLTEPLEGEIVKPVEQTLKIDETPAVQSEVTNNPEVSPDEELKPKETESKVLENDESLVEPNLEVVATENIKTEEVPAETNPTEKEAKEEVVKDNKTEGEAKEEVMKEIKSEEKPKDSEIVVPEPETEGKSTTTSAPAVDPIELALQNENYSNDDTFLNETL